MRIVSTFPSGTEIVAALGLADQLVGISHQCKSPAEVQHLPRVTRSTIDGLTDPAEISATISERHRNGLPVYELDETLLAELQPDFIVGQDVCTVCALPSETAVEAGIRLDHPARTISLQARRLNDIMQNIVQVADFLGVSERGSALVADLESRLEQVAATVAGHGRPRVFAVEWMEPLKNSGAWIPDLIYAAGGESVLSAGGDSVRRVGWDELVAAAPEVLIIAPCGWTLDESWAHMDRLTRHPSWAGLPAVVNGSVYVMDGSLCSKHAPNTVAGVELLARLIHPTAFPADKSGHVDPKQARRWEPAEAAVEAANV